MGHKYVIAERSMIGANIAHENGSNAVGIDEWAMLVV